jgi:general secretion pathway protein A
VLILDEAQNLPPGVLEQVRLLTNLETSTEKLLQVILIGQPELLRLLGRRDLRQLAQRITARCHLQPFSRRETRRYIAHRLSVAGGGPHLFTPPAIRRIHRVSGGVPRLVNVLCDRALLGAYTRGERGVGARIARQAAHELRGVPWSWRRQPRMWFLGAAALGLAALAAGLVLGGLIRLPHLGTRMPVGAAQPARVEPSGASARSESGAMQGAPALADPAAPARLADLLAEGAAGEDEDAQAFAGVYARWGLSYAGGARGCTSAQPLECTVRRGNWTRVRRYDLPAVLEVTTPEGDPRRVALLGLDGAEAVLAVDGQERRFPLAEIDGLWDGSFILLWRAPAVRSRLIGSGTQGEDVRWLRRTLDALDGAEPPAEPEDVPALYDEPLKRRVQAFQRSRGMIPDGIVGEETLLELAVATRGPDVPSLSRATP